MKVVISSCFGGFCVSRKAVEFMAARGNAAAMASPANGCGDSDLYRRDDPDLIAAVEELGEDAGGGFSALKVVEIPDDVDWRVEQFGGKEWVAEKHRTWC